MRTGIETEWVVQCETRELCVPACASWRYITCHFEGDLKFIRGSDGLGKVSTLSRALKSCDVGICLPDLVTTCLSSVSSSVCLLACTEAEKRKERKR